MPSVESILAGLELAANRALPLAVVWHAMFGAALIALALRVRPSCRVAAALLVAPLASVAGVAWWFGNPFNGALFSLGALVLLVLAARAHSARVVLGTRFEAAAGLALIAFGWVYPHFLAQHAAAVYLYAAPLGLVPCPTLSATIGFALLGGGLGARGYARALAVLGVFYGGFGVFRLEVFIDGVLLAGSLVLLRAARKPAASRAALLHEASAHQM